MKFSEKSAAVHLTPPIVIMISSLYSLVCRLVPWGCGVWDKEGRERLRESERHRGRGSGRWRESET